MVNLIVLADKTVRKISTLWREYVFKKSIGKAATGLHIYGKVYLINNNIVVGNNVRIYPGVQLFGDGPISIGDNVSIGNNVMIYASANGGVTIGDNTIIAAQSYIVDMNHGMDKSELIREQKSLAKAIVIGDDVWIGGSVTILKGVTVGKGAVIGAKALVNNNIEPYDIVAGIPCKVIGRRK